MPRQRREEHVIIDARVRNWARVFGGGLPDPTRQAAERGTPDEIDAECVEAAMCQLKRFRPQYWRVVEAKYLRRFMDESGAQAVRLPIRTYQDLASRSLDYLAGKLDESHISRVYSRAR